MSGTLRQRSRGLGSTTARWRGGSGCLVRPYATGASGARRTAALGALGAGSARSQSSSSPRPTPSCSASISETARSAGWLARPTCASRSTRATPGSSPTRCALLNRTFPANRVGLLPSASNGTAIPYVYSRHLPCAFPQHGRGKKHERRISLERWQEDLVAQAPWALLRGLIRSDGCVFINRTGPYRYESYGFYNRSTDILDLFARTCDQVGVAYRRNHRAIRINRRTAVAAMLQHVGRKS